MEFGQLPAEGDAAVPAKGGGQLVQGGPQPVGRLVEEDGPPLPLQRGQTPAAQPALGGQKALKHPAGGVLPRDGQGGDAGRRPRHRSDGDAPGQRVPDDDRAGVGDAGHPRVGAEGAALPCLDPAEDALPPAQGVLVVADHGFFQAQMVQKPHGDPGVLGGDEIRRPQRGGGPGGHVLQVADGGGDDIERSGHKIPPVTVRPGGPARTGRPRRRPEYPAPGGGRCGGFSALPPERARAPPPPGCGRKPAAWAPGGVPAGWPAPRPAARGGGRGSACPRPAAGGRRRHRRPPGCTGPRGGRRPGRGRGSGARRQNRAGCRRPGRTGRPRRGRASSCAGRRRPGGCARCPGRRRPGPAGRWPPAGSPGPGRGRGGPCRAIPAPPPRSPSTGRRPGPPGGGGQSGPAAARRCQTGGRGCSRCWSYYTKFRMNIP